MTVASFVCLTQTLFFFNIYNGITGNLITTKLVDKQIYIDGFNTN